MAWVGALVGVVGSAFEAKQQKEAAYVQAAELDRQADTTFAAGTMEAFEQGRKGQFVLSNARAAMAANGGVTTDAQALQQLSAIDTENEYRRIGILFDSRSNAENMRRSAENIRKTGNMQAISTVMTGAMNAFSSWKSSNPGGGYKSDSSSGLSDSDIADMETFQSTYGNGG